MRQIGPFEAPSQYVTFREKIKEAMQCGCHAPSTCVDTDEQVEVRREHGTVSRLIVKEPSQLHFKTLERFPPAMPASDRSDGNHHEHPGGAGYYSVTMVRFKPDSDPVQVCETDIGIGCKEQLWEGWFSPDLPVEMWPVGMLELIIDEAFEQMGVWEDVNYADEQMNELDRSWGEMAAPAD